MVPPLSLMQHERWLLVRHIPHWRALVHYWTTTAALISTDTEHQAAVFTGSQSLAGSFKPHLACSSLLLHQLDTRIRSPPHPQPYSWLRSDRDPLHTDPQWCSWGWWTPVGRRRVVGHPAGGHTPCRLDKGLLSRCLGWEGGSGHLHYMDRYTCNWSSALDPLHPRRALTPYP